MFKNFTQKHDMICCVKVECVLMLFTLYLLGVQLLNENLKHMLSTHPNTNVYFNVPNLNLTTIKLLYVL